jgi:hypothetical protein
LNERGAKEDREKKVKTIYVYAGSYYSNSILNSEGREETQRGEKFFPSRSQRPLRLSFFLFLTSK